MRLIPLLKYLYGCSLLLFINFTNESKLLSTESPLNDTEKESVIYTPTLPASCDNINAVSFAFSPLQPCGPDQTISFNPGIEIDTSLQLISAEASPLDFRQAFNFDFPTEDNGCTYFLEIAGGYSPWGSNEWLDAFSGYNLLTNERLQINGLSTDLNPRPISGPTEYNPTHIYQYGYTGDGRIINFRYLDSFYEDNMGEVNFNWFIKPCFSFEWDFGDGTSSPEVAPAHTYAIPGTYSVVLTITDLTNNCSVSDTSIVEIFSNPILDYTIETPCVDHSNGSIELLPEGIVAPYLFSLNGIDLQEETIFNSLSEGIYDLTIIDTTNNCLSTQSIEILNSQSKIIDECGDCFERDDPNFNQACSDCAGTPNGNALIDECGECLEVDDPNVNQSCADCAGIPNGTAEIDGCSVCLQPDNPDFNLSCTRDIYIPNVFTPNNDGINDFFQIHKVPTTIAQINSYNIFNRWGELIYQAKNFGFEDQSQWWNGEFRGEKMDIGIYIFYIEVAFQDGTISKHEGSISIVK